MEQDGGIRGRPRDENLKARREEEILSVAARVFAEHGYRQTDVQIVADKLGIGKGTVYRYFPTKEDLFFSAVDAGMRALLKCVDDAVLGEEDPVNHIGQAVRAYLGFFDKQPELVELLIIERAEFPDREKGTYFAYKEHNESRWRNFIESAIESGVIRDMPVDSIMNVMGDTLYGAIFTNHFSGRKMPFEKQAHNMLEIIFRGILSDNHREFQNQEK